MPVFDGTNLSGDDEGEALLALILHPTLRAREDACERGRRRLERATMLAELAPAVPGATLAPLTRGDILPVT